MLVLLILNLTQKFVENNNSNNVLDYICLCLYHTCLCIREMEESNDIRNGREELGLFCYYKVLTTCEVE